jgi:uncharacterized DUF497 family protein
VRIYALIVEPGREEHIARHHVHVSEVEEVVDSTHFVTRTRQGRYRLIGQTQAGRYLTIIVVPRGSGIYSLVTARDADDAERRLYQRNRRN